MNKSKNIIAYAIFLILLSVSIILYFSSRSDESEKAFTASLDAAFSKGTDIFLSQILPEPWDQVCLVEYPRSGPDPDLGFIESQLANPPPNWHEQIHNTGRVIVPNQSLIFIKDGNISRIITFRHLWIRSYSYLSLYKDGKIQSHKFDTDGCTTRQSTKIRQTKSPKSHPSYVLTSEGD